MIKAFAASALLVSASAAAAASQPTNFGIRTATAGPKVVTPIVEEAAGASRSHSVSLGSASSSRPSIAGVAAIGARWGKVTSTYRTPQRNRAVGGAPNSYHLRGRAIDIARRPGVRHSDIAAAYRAAGYHLVESLDEGDHSHFAFGTGAYSPPVTVAKKTEEVTSWHMVYAPGAGGR